MKQTKTAYKRIRRKCRVLAYITYLDGRREVVLERVG